MGLFNGVVEHADEDVGVLCEPNHELLPLLQHTEAGLVDDVHVVEEEVVLAAQLDAQRVRAGVVALVGWGRE